jgi:hypothetical protein
VSQAHQSTALPRLHVLKHNELHQHLKGILGKALLYNQLVRRQMESQKRRSDLMIRLRTLNDLLDACKHHFRSEIRKIGRLGAKAILDVDHSACQIHGSKDTARIQKLLLKDTL